MKIGSGIAALTLAAMLVLAGCGSQNAETAPQQTADDSVEPVAGDIDAATREAINDTQAAAREAAATGDAAADTEPRPSD